jgi:DNA-binding CsgD family transcriptional regulator
MEGPWDLLELPKDTDRLIHAVESTVRRTQALRRWMGVGSEACGPAAREPDAPVVREHIDSRIVRAAQALAAPEKLAQEELEVLRELAAGHRPAEIARRTGKSAETVRTQVKALRHKLGARSVVHLLALINAEAFEALSIESVVYE